MNKNKTDQLENLRDEIQELIAKYSKELNETIDENEHLQKLYNISNDIEDEIY